MPSGLPFCDQRNETMNIFVLTEIILLHKKFFIIHYESTYNT